MEERNLKRKIIVLLVCMALLVGVLISGCIEEEKEEEEEEKEELDAIFTYSPTTIYANTVVTFTDGSKGSPTSWAWEFGDNSTSILQSPTHAYAAVGTYKVNLTVTDSDGNTDTTSKNVILSYKPPSAAITTDPDVTDTSVNITVNLTTITFTDNSTAGDGTINNWTWNFGDGTASVYTQNATHMYNATGTYTVKLTVKDENLLKDEATVSVEVKAAT